MNKLDEVADRTVAGLLGELAERVAVLESAVQGRSGAENPQVAPLGSAADGPDQLALALGNSRLAALLVAGGFGSLAAVRAASDGELLAVAGVTAKGLKLIRERVGGPP